MQVGLIGFGYLGARLALSLGSEEHEVIAYDPGMEEDVIEQLPSCNVYAVRSLKDLAESTTSKRVILMILDEFALDETLDELLGYLSVGDILVDISDSLRLDTARRAQQALGLQINYLDCAAKVMSHPKAGLRIVVGGNRFAFNHCEEIWQCLTNTEYIYAGRSGSGHATLNVEQ
ncbi:MAG TPA: NAD(P)-binding domain-containing protein [Ohtaekwangia sp.]|uniref:NAD(P)-binding domain-containing protein n=1 Tax=Ohtaekwangia sp. TaxID=2066019 RepID=UPI002F95BEDA